jgi:hypothetical protein
MTRRGGAIALLLLTGVLAASPAYAGSGDGPRCHIEFTQSENKYLPPRGDFIVHSPGHRGAVGVWKNSTGDKVHVRVDGGEGTASKRRGSVGRREYDLIRCETVR